MTYVIIGGPHDGQRINVTERLQQVYLACFADVTTIYDFSEVIETSALCNTELYELTELATKYFSYTFYRHHSMTVDNAIATLINGYRHSPKE